MGRASLVSPDCWQSAHLCKKCVVQVESRTPVRRAQVTRSQPEPLQKVCCSSCITEAKCEELRPLNRILNSTKSVLFKMESRRAVRRAQAALSLQRTRTESVLFRPGTDASCEELKLIISQGPTDSFMPVVPMAWGARWANEVSKRSSAFPLHNGPAPKSEAVMKTRSSWSSGESDLPRHAQRGRVSAAGQAAIIRWVTKGSTELRRGF